MSSYDNDWEYQICPGSLTKDRLICIMPILDKTAILLKSGHIPDNKVHRAHMGRGPQGACWYQVGPMLAP